MKLIIMLSIASIMFVAIPASATDYDDIGTYTYNCDAGSSGTGYSWEVCPCYQPGEAVYSHTNPPYQFADFSVDSSSPAWPNDNTQNGYQIYLDGYQEVWLYVQCTVEDIKSVDLDVSSEVNCKLEGKGDHHQKYRCRNDHSGTHHVTLEHYKCGCDKD